MVGQCGCTGVQLRPVDKFYGLNICSSPNTYVETLIPSMVVFGDEALGRN